MNRKFRKALWMAVAEWKGTSTTRFAPHGVDIEIPKGVDDNIRYQLTRGRGYEDPEAAFIKSTLRTGMDVVELGGSLGVISALIRSVIGPNARHIIVEANTALLDICRTNATRGAATGATDVVFGAIDYSGTADVFFDTGSGAHVGTVSAQSTGTAVPATTLAKVAQDLPRFALVCDIEGMEADVMAQDAAVLDKVDVVVLEIHPQLYADAPQTIADIESALVGAGLRLVGRDADVICYDRPASDRA